MIDPNVQKIVTDVNAMAVALQQLIGTLTQAQGQILTLTNQLANLNQQLTQAGIGQDNVTALQSASAALEASIASAKAATTS